MTTATPKKNKATRRPRCKHCHKQFKTTSTVAIFCTRTCKDKATATKRRIKYVAKATDSAFFKQLAFEASRAGTLEIFTGHTAESLAELYKLYAFKLKANQYGKSTDYELSHICAVQGEDAVGLYHPLNLVVAPKALNRAHGNQHFGHGLSIARGSLKSRHTVEKGANQKDTVARIVQFIGPDIVAQAVKLAGIKPSVRNTTLTWLRDHLVPSVPEHRDWLDGLDTMQTPALKALRAKLEGKEVSGFTIKTTISTPFDVLSQELERHAQRRPELTEVLDVICKRVRPFTALHMSRTTLNEEELQAVFDVLHGKSVEAIRPVLTEFVERHTSAMDNGERISPYKPIVFKAKPVRGPAKVVVTLQSPMSFAAELDAQLMTPEVIPVLHLSTV
ncbi:hypothetical protein CS078_21715 [Pseudomonas prosekii]|uniref:Uncharacterized protein n=1 Tax=Pseudomonas prosekii TaxID=1148509 RepID=A0A3L8CDV4_9PSED|nr:hypothetical protein [Pseudomonas prosekii]RLU06347.1 hypothetical protein CS078_21715 [Pseudomonas prosekii]RLU13950.1 hypothetical protein CS076_01995 [Pseudomonas prosekii]